MSPRRPPTWIAVTALVCGVVALLLCWIPLVNLLAIIAALGGVVLGVLALVLGRRGLHGGRKRAAVGVAASALALVVALVVDVVYVVQLGDRLVSTSAPPARPAPSASASAQDPSPSTSPAPSESASSPAAPPSSAPAAALEGLPYGQSTTVGDYTVTITGVNTDADAAIAEANQFNKPPTGRYVLADVSVVYNGTEEGIPWAQLQMAFLGTDARNYSWTSCTATVPRPGFQQPNLRAGGAAEYQVCFDLPAEAIAGGAIEAKNYSQGQPATWAVPA